MSAISEMLSEIEHPSYAYMYEYIEYYIEDIHKGNKDTSPQNGGKKYLTELLEVVDKEIEVLKHYLSRDDISFEDKFSIEEIIVEYWNDENRRDLLNKIKDNETDPDLKKLKVLKDLLEQYQEKSSELARVKGPKAEGPASGKYQFTESKGLAPIGDDYSQPSWLVVEKTEEKRLAAEKRAAAEEKRVTAAKERAAAEEKRAAAEKEQAAAAKERADSLEKQGAAEEKKAEQSKKRSKGLLDELDSVAASMDSDLTSAPSQAPKSVKTSDMLRELDEMLNSSGGDGAGRAGGGGKSSKSKRKSSKKSKRRKSSKRKRSKKSRRRR